VNKRLWIFQYPSEVKKKGADKASWYVGWYDHDNKRHAESCGPGARGKNKAEKRLRHLQSELDMGLHQPPSKQMWPGFRKEYEKKVYPNMAAQSREVVTASLGHFQRIIRPGRMDKITTQTIDTFVAARRAERGKNPGSKVAAATINKDLRHLKAALRIAGEWGMLPKTPRIKMVREPEKLIRYVTPEHFEKLYREASSKAELPMNPGQSYQPKVWWQALLATAYMTGWRIRELLSLRTEDVDLDAGTVITRHADNKGKRDAKVPVHQAVLEHLRLVIGSGKFVFAWTHGDKRLWQEFRRIQEAVGIHLTCLEDHDHTPPCHVYGFHDLRRGFATVNGKGMKPEVLQQVMRHKSYTTTLGYINLAEQVEEAVKAIKTPDALKGAAKPASKPGDNEDASSADAGQSPSE
jgi:integrase